MKEHDWLIRKSGKSRVDAAYDVSHATMHFVLFRSLKGNLDQNNLLLEFWMFIQKRLEREQFVSYALEMVDLLSLYTSLVKT